MKFAAMHESGSGPSPPFGQSTPFPVLEKADKGAGTAQANPSNPTMRRLILACALAHRRADRQDHASNVELRNPTGDRALVRVSGSN
jgi:hypothetical protein